MRRVAFSLVSAGHGGPGTGSASITPDDIDLVRTVPLFSGLSAKELGGILSSATATDHPRGTTIFHQGEIARFLHILLDGEVGLVAAGRDGESTVVEILNPGEIFVTAAALTQKPYLMGGVTLAPSRIMALPAGQLRRDIHEVPQLAVGMLQSMSRHFRMLVREVKDLKLKSASQRLALYLLALSPGRDGPATVQLPHNKGLIAARVGMRPETMSRAFVALRDQGVHVKGSKVFIADRGQLAVFSQESGETI